MPLVNFDEIPPREICPGFRGRYSHSDRITQGRVDVDAGAALPQHSHPHEQWTHVLSGSLELTVNGVAQVLQAGQLLYIPPNAPHSGRGLTDCLVVDVFCPVREDYR